MKKLSVRSIICIFSILYLVAKMSYAGHYEAYMNATLGLSIRSPDGWFIEMKDNPSAAAKYAFADNPHLFVLFSKYDFNNLATWPNPLGSMILVYVLPTTKESPLALMNSLYGTRSGEGKKVIIEAPHEIKLNDHLWAVMTTRMERLGIVAYEVAYTGLYENGSVSIQATSTEPDYNKSRQIFDKVVSQIIFDSNADSLAAKATSLK